MGRQAELETVVRESTRRSSHAVVRGLSRLLFAAMVAFAASTPVAAQQPGADGPSKALEGRWKLELYLDTPSARTSPMAGQINGEIAFSNTAWWNARDRFGRHDLDLQSFFGRSFLRPANVTAFGPADTSMVTEVSGNVRNDSLTIDFIPRIDHGGVSLWGRFWGDSAKGKWDRRGSDGDGHFVLRRISSEPVAVAAIPVGRPAAVAVAAAVPEKPLTKAQLRAKARADAAEKAKADALARRQARDSAVAQAALLAKAKRDSQAVVLAAAKARRDSVAAAKVATAKAKSDSVAAARVARAAATPAAAATLAANTPNTPTTPAAPTPAASSAEKSTATKTLATTSATRPATRPATIPAAAAPTATTSAGAPNAGPAAASLASTPARPTATTPTRPVPAATTAAATTTPGAAASTVPGAAPLRVRLYDIATNTYVSTKYSLHLPDGHWLYGTLRTGSTGEGYGTPVVRAPGNYEIEVTDFMCGDKVWFLKNKILQKVAIQPGVPADVTIDVNLATEPARPSLENKTGALCTSPPGVAR